MASSELMQRWNRVDEHGSIQPPVSETEADAYAAKGVYPESLIAFRTYRDVARVALINCNHIRTPGNPAIAAMELGSHKIG